MDLISKGRLDAFCLVTSDSDFTRLAQRLREVGLTVYSFGETKRFGALSGRVRFPEQVRDGRVPPCGRQFQRG